MTLNVIDISSWQTGINLGKDGVPADGVVIKATGGTGYVNTDCDRAFQEAIKSGKKVAVYHYAHEIGFQGTAEQEAEFFLQNVAGYIGKAILILDWESDNKHDVAWAKRWLDTVYEKTGIKPLFYTYTHMVNNYDFSSIGNADYGLWIANYLSDKPQGYSQPAPPISNGFPLTVMYQYTSSGKLPGWGGYLDLNVFYGTLEDWDLYATGSKRPEKENEEINNNKKEVATMHCIYERPMRDGKPNNDNGNTWGKYYCNGVNCRHIPYEDNVKLLKELYKKNNGHEMPVYTKEDWTIYAPWYKRLEEMFPVV